MSARYFGASVPRLEDERLVTGHGRYVDDIELPGLLHVAFVRSQMPHARLGAVDTAAAAAMPGVIAVFTMRDFAEIAAGPMPPMAPHPLVKVPLTCHPLAVDEVNYAGEAIAMVIAQDRAIAESAAALVIVELTELPGVANAVRALEPNAPLAQTSRDSNLLASLKSQFGNVADVFAKADHVISETFITHRGGCHSMECRGVVASFDGMADQLVLYTSSQAPYMVRRLLTSYLGWDERQIRVAAPDVGGGFGPKANVYTEEFAVAMAAIKLGRPIKWI